MLSARQRALSAASSSSSSSPAPFIRSPCTPSTSGQRLQPRLGEALVAHADAFCRDKVSLQRTTVASKGETYKLTFVAAGGESKEISCPDDKYILDAAEAGGLDLPATCRGGICGACVARVTSGTFDSSDIADLSFTLNEDEQAKGMALLCMTRATSDLVIETQSDWGYGLGLNDWQVTGKFSAKPDPLMGSEWGKK